MKSYVIYARKSSESEDRQVLSIDSQVTELKNLAAHAGVEVADVLTESKSAKAPGRPVFGDLMRRIWKGRVHGLLAWKIDRLARNPFDQGQILQALSDGQLEQIITVDRTYTRDGNDRFIGNFEFGIATKYIDDLSQNVRRGNRAKFAQGWLNHNPPLGYLMDPATKTIIADPDRFDLVQRMWELVLTGSYRPRQVAEIASREWGFRTRQYKRTGGKPMSASTFYSMLENPFYMGLIRLRSGETYPGAHPAMVSHEQFQRVQSLLGRPGRQRPQKHNLAYTGLFRCGNCGARITGEHHTKPSGLTYVYYRCTWRKSNIVCREPAISEADLERQLASYMERITLPEEVVSYCHDRVNEMLAADVTRREQARNSLLVSRSVCAGEAETLLDLRLRNLISDEKYVEKKRRLDERSSGISQSLNRLDSRLATMGRTIQKAFHFAHEAPRLIQTGTAVQKRMLLEAVGMNWQLKDRRVATELKRPFQLMAETVLSCVDIQKSNAAVRKSSVSGIGGLNSRRPLEFPLTLNKKPLQGLLGPSLIPNWSALVEDVWKWLQDTEEYFDIPDELMEGFETSKYHKDKKRQGR